MRTFVTGATGFIGSAIVDELLTAGHQVIGLARNDASAAALARRGVEVHRGDLSDHESLMAGARAADGVIHTAFVHDFSAFAAAIETDRAAIGALVRALEGSGKPFVSTSGTLGLPHGRVVTEEDVAPAGSPLGARALAEEVVLAGAGRGVRASLVRLPPTVHGRGDHGFVPQLVEVARRTGVAAYVGDGANRWPAVHRLDAARLFVRALKSAPAGTRLHGVGEEGVAMRAIAEAIGAGLGVPVRSISAEEAGGHFGWLGGVVGADNPTGSGRTREVLGWGPREVGLIEDMRSGGYFG